jgi:hypothetical protein
MHCGSTYFSNSAKRKKKKKEEEEEEKEEEGACTMINVPLVSTHWPITGEGNPS